MPDPTQALASAMTAAAAEIDQALDTLIPPSEGDEARLFEAMRYASIGGGKRLRGFLVLEGAAQDLDRLMTRLRQDRRHDGLRILSERAVEQRRFGDWAMVRLDAPPAATTFLEQHLDAPDAGARAEALLIEASRSMAVAP
jgi:geranylgeranyl pyrophosphate synthase